MPAVLGEFGNKLFNTYGNMLTDEASPGKSPVFQSPIVPKKSFSHLSSDWPNDDFLPRLRTSTMALPLGQIPPSASKDSPTSFGLEFTKVVDHSENSFEGAIAEAPIERKLGPNGL